jgi:pyruvate dehydrogenase E1 component
MAMFASLAQDYSRRHFDTVRDRAPGRMIALVGDAEMDEGNMYEAILEGWKHNLRNCWWIIDYNRQSLDGVRTPNARGLEGTDAGFTDCRSAGG